MGADTDGICIADEVTIVAGAGAGVEAADAAIAEHRRRFSPSLSRASELLFNHRNWRSLRAANSGFRFRAGIAADYSSPISTAMRIRSEWFFAPSFCFSSEVVLATVL